MKLSLARSLVFIALLGLSVNSYACSSLFGSSQSCQLDSDESKSGCAANLIPNQMFEAVMKQWTAVITPVKQAVEQFTGRYAQR